MYGTQIPVMQYAPQYAPVYKAAPVIQYAPVNKATVPPAITTLTDTRVIGALLNTRIKGKKALTNILFPESRQRTLFTEYEQVDVLTGAVGMAPFNRIGQKAIMVGGLNGTSYMINTPFINIERTLQYSTEFAKRQAGQPVFINSDQNRQFVRTALEQDVDVMNDMIDNRIEWMVAMILRGQIEYSVVGQDSFIINSGKPAANTFTVSILWNAGSATPLEDIGQAKRIVSLKNGPLPNMAICGANAAKQLRALVEAGSIKPIATTSGVIATERVNLLSQYQESGLMYMGKFGDVDFFEYLGTYIDDTTGLTTPLIRTDYIEFVSTADLALSMRELLFGSMPDLLIIRKGEHVTKRHLTSVEPKPDQGAYEGIMKSRPFPHLKRPDWLVSMKVV